jgi:hypothetical protein
MKAFSLYTSLILALAAMGTPAAESAEPPGKYHPGHYVAISEAESVAGIQHLDEAALRGVSRRYYWADLEPKKDAYDFAPIRADLELLKKHDKQLVVFITDKTFNRTRNPLPGYLSAYTLPNLRGVTAKRWDPVVIERLLALSQALAKEFDNHPNFEGIAFQESALMISPAIQRQEGYTPEKYRDALIQILTESSRAFHQSWVFWYMNHLEGNEGYLGEIAQALVHSRVVMGGPDILPFRRRLQATYQLYERFNGQLKLFCSAQEDSYRHDRNDSRTMGNAAATRDQPAPAGGYVPMDQIFLFARDKLHVNYLFWTYKNYRGNPGSFSYDDALKVMRQYPSFQRGETKSR